MAQQFTHLHVYSDNSLLEGFGLIKEYVQLAKEYGQESLALTDHNSMVGVYDFLNKCKEAGIKGIAGVEFNIAPITDDVMKPVQYHNTLQFVPNDGTSTTIVLLAKNYNGLKGLFKLTKESYHTDTFLVKPRLMRNSNILKEYAKDLICITGSPTSELGVRIRLNQMEEAKNELSFLKGLFHEDDVYIEIMSIKGPAQYDVTQTIQFALTNNTQMVYTNHVYCAKQEDMVAQEIVMAYGAKSKLEETPTTLGGKRPKLPDNERYLKDLPSLLKHIQETCQHIPNWKQIFSTAIKNTQVVADKVDNIMLEYNSHLQAEAYLLEGFSTSYDYIKHLIQEGFNKKRKHLSREIQLESKKRVQHELEVLRSNNFLDYFILVQDYIQWTRKQGFLVGPGRGCFLPGNMVNTSQGYKPIEMVEVGELVHTHDGSLQTVEHIWEYIIQESVIRFTLSNGKRITCTKDHLLKAVIGHFIPAEDIQVGDELCGKYEQSVPRGNLTYYSERFMDTFSCRNRPELFMVQFVETIATVQQISLVDEGLKVYYYNQEPKVYTKADCIARMNNLTNLEREEITVIKKEIIPYVGKVYDLKVSNTLNYMISDVVVHNSVGGSEIAYLMDISRTDPIRFDLMFERFISPGRGAKYEIEYEDGTTEVINVSETKEVNGTKKYIHELTIGDEITE